MVNTVFRKGLVILIILIFICSSVVSGFNIQINNKNITLGFVRGNTLYVGGSGHNNYTEIQNAIDNASDGDLIFVYEGIYVDNIFISKKIKLIGESKETTKIDGSGEKVIKTNYSGACTISNFTIFNGSYGLYIHSDNTNILDNIIINNTIGIHTGSLDQNITISNNYITGKKWGVKIDNSNEINIYHNSFNDCGIKLYSGISNRIYENQIKDAETAIYIDSCLYTKINRNNIINENENLVKFKNYNKFFPRNNWNHNYWSDWIYFFPPFILSPPRVIEGKIILWSPFTSGPEKEIDWIEIDWFPAKEPYDIGL